MNRDILERELPLPDIVYITRKGDRITKEQYGQERIKKLSKTFVSYGRL